MSSEKTLPFKQGNPFYHQELRLGSETCLLNLSLWLSDFHEIISAYYSQIKMSVSRMYWLVLLVRTLFSLGETLGFSHAFLLLLGSWETQKAFCGGEKFPGEVAHPAFHPEISRVLPFLSEPSEASDRSFLLFSEFLKVRRRRGVFVSPGEDLVYPQCREEQWGLSALISCLGIGVHWCDWLAWGGGIHHRNPGLQAWAGVATNTIVQSNTIQGRDWSYVTLWVNWRTVTATQSSWPPVQYSFYSAH